MQVIKHKDNKVTIRIQDYADRITSLDFDLDEIDIIQRFEISSDDCIEVYFKNGEVKWYDSCDCRVTSYLDDNKIIYYNGELKCDYEED